MNIWLIVTVLLVILSFALVLFGSETASNKFYKAIGAAAMGVVGVAGASFIIKNT